MTAEKTPDTSLGKPTGKASGKSTKAKQSKASLSRQEILLVAAKMMRNQGYSNMSLRGLAEQVGMKAGSLYYHFSSKDALATEVMRVGVEVVSSAVTDGLAALEADISSHERVMAAMRIHMETLISASDFSSAHIRCYPFVPEGVRADLLASRRSYDRLWDKILRDHLASIGDDRLTDPAEPDQHVRYLRHAILGAMNWSLEWFDPKRDDVARYITSLEPFLGPR
ncbi:MAG: TetR/AcrR family transcriptional regulator [Cohaesibacter sp.]|jgi:AcrR family transcriptional regulator|nr:TetR/AcrR family transcriptional regulator [Cohaesibacter sp.]